MLRKQWCGQNSIIASGRSGWWPTLRQNGDTHFSTSHFGLNSSQAKTYSAYIRANLCFLLKLTFSSRQGVCKFAKKYLRRPGNTGIITRCGELWLCPFAFIKLNYSGQLFIPVTYFTLSGFRVSYMMLYSTDIANAWIKTFTRGMGATVGFSTGLVWPVAQSFLQSVNVSGLHSEQIWRPALTQAYLSPSASWIGYTYESIFKPLLADWMDRQLQEALDQDLGSHFWDG